MPQSFSFSFSGQYALILGDKFLDAHITISPPDRSVGEFRPVIEELTLYHKNKPFIPSKNEFEEVKEILREYLSAG